MRGPSRCLASTAWCSSRVHEAAMSACGPTRPKRAHGRRGCRSEGSGRRSATSRSLRMPRWPGQRQRLKAFVIFAARESRLRAIQVLVRDPISIGVTSLSPIHHRSCSHSPVTATRLILDRKTFRGSGFLPSLAVRPQPDLFWSAAHELPRKRAAGRAFAERIQLLVTVLAGWRAVCPATAARPAIAHRCGSRRHGHPS